MQLYFDRKVMYGNFFLAPTVAEGSQPFAFLIPDRLKMGVKQEIEDLLSQGII